MNSFLMIALLIVCYLIGSIPFGLLLTKLACKEDIRNIGSGNIGATNVLRTGKKYLAALTLLCDMGKGAIAVLLIGYFDEKLMPFGGLAVLLGHLYPIWLKLKGGKGVATFFGVLTTLSLPVGLFAIAVWLSVTLIMRISSLSAIVAVASAPIFYAIYNETPPSGIILLMCLLILIKHADNIKRLVNGKEPKIGHTSTK